MRRFVLISAALLTLSCAHPRVQYASPILQCTKNGDCAKARELCASGEPHACIELGMMDATFEYYDGHPAPERHARGDALLIRACRLNRSTCWVVTSVAGSLTECSDDYQRETRLLRAACDENYPTACAHLAYKYVDGVDVPRDTERAAKLFAGACDAADDFPPFEERSSDDDRPLHVNKDPLEYQVLACVAFERLKERGLNGEAKAQTTPERALELTLERGAKYGETRISRVPLPRRVPANWLELQRSSVRSFGLPPRERAEMIRHSRETLPSGAIQFCPPLGARPPE